MLKFSAWLAIGFALFLAIGEAVRNWGDWQWWPFWVVDYVAATLLFSGGVSALRTNGTKLLAGSWGFACAMSYMSFFSHIDVIQKGPLATYGPQGTINEQTLTGIIGILLVIAIIGFATSLFAKTDK